MQSVPRPLASVSLGGSLRASRAALLARPHGPLAAVDLADGRALTVQDRGAGWVVCIVADDTAAPAEQAPAAAPAPVRRRGLGAALVLAGALGAAIVALATGFSGAPAPAVAGPTVRAGPAVPVAGPLPHAARPPAARGGRAPALPHVPPPVAPVPPPATPVAATPQPPPEPPPLPALPSVPALGGMRGV